MKVFLEIKFNLPVDTYEDALKYLKKLMEEYAGSNDGSEFLAKLRINEETVHIDM